MPLYYLLVITAGILSGLLFWDVYKVMNPETLTLPEIKAQTSLPASAAMWGPWLDPVTSKPPVQAAPSKPKKQVQVKRTIDLQVALIGVFGGRRNGVAIMGVAGKEHQVYIVGDFVHNDIVLAEVRLNSILLGVEDVEREYTMHKAEPVIERINDNLQSVNQPPPQPQLQPEAVVQPIIKAKPIQQQRQQPVTPATRKQITSVRKTVQEKPLSVLGLGKFKLTRSQGQLGVQVKSFKYRDVLVGVGLRLDDIVISVNGKSIQDITRSPQLANSLLKLSRFEVVVIRNGRRISVPVQW